MGEKDTNQISAKVFRDKGGFERLLLEEIVVIKPIADDLYSVTSGKFYFDGINLQIKGSWTYTQFANGGDKIESNGTNTTIDNLFKSAKIIQLNN